MVNIPENAEYVNTLKTSMNLKTMAQLWSSLDQYKPIARQIVIP